MSLTEKNGTCTVHLYYVFMTSAKLNQIKQNNSSKSEKLSECQTQHKRVNFPQHPDSSFNSNLFIYLF